MNQDYTYPEEIEQQEEEKKQKRKIARKAHEQDEIMTRLARKQNK